MKKKATMSLERKMESITGVKDKDMGKKYMKSIGMHHTGNAAMKQTAEESSNFRKKGVKIV